MGGHAAGEVASEMAVEMVSHELADLNDLAAAEAHERVARALRDANRAVYERTRTERDKLGMGSTVSALLLSETRYLVGHVGDSRIYLVRDGEMRQLTKDHSLVQEQVDAGLLTPEQARRHPQSNVITRCIGMADEIEPDVFEGDARYARERAAVSLEGQQQVTAASFCRGIARKLAEARGREAKGER